MSDLEKNITIFFLDRHRPCRSHNSLIAYDDDPDDDDPDDCLSSFFASFFQDLVLARVSFFWGLFLSNFGFD